jgi:polynucleotide 5'-hydroxyl-kinase GRC3/NOL9
MLYKSCANDLIRHAERAYPLIINACGWTSGLGASVLLDLVVDLAVTDAVLLEPLDVDLVRPLQSVSNNVILHRISRRGPRPSTRSPAETRAMQNMAYFHYKFGSSGDVQKFTGKSVGKMRHWNVIFAGPRPGIAAVMSYNRSPNPEFLAETLDGSVVAIVVQERNESREASAANEGADVPRDISEYISRTPEDIPYVEANSMNINRTLDPSSSHCVGLALIRGIDVVAQCFQLLTPLPKREIDDLASQQVVLVRGSFDSPGWAFLEDIYKGEHEGEAVFEDGTRPWVSERGQVGIESAVWRLRHPPLANAQMMNAAGKV